MTANRMGLPPAIGKCEDTIVVGTKEKLSAQLGSVATGWTKLNPLRLSLCDLSVLALSLWSECDELVPAFATVMQMDIRSVANDP
ncbi:hypothetical protein KIN20_008394 [Parelaphostrongylus tenuis]|uniref:Uncharacterized protein n=1 Tax=Parelaphostrongylus tenuis TaxID=148309 RepID=A0AAD5M7Z1_PARTN|nr:hypothetical protein KIN20_008394 [Parelaphostrongylus tenuis]